MAINLPSINPPSSPVPDGWRGLEEESYDLMQETITQKVATAGRLMDTMLDALEGREDVLPDRWITELEEVEEGVSRWEMDGERVVLEGRLRLEEVRARRDRQGEEARERRKTLLVLEQERSALEARVEEDAAFGVMEKAEETDRQLREALEVNDIVAEAIELPDDDEGDWIEVGSDEGEMGELLSKLETVEKERQLTDEIETRGRRVKREGSFDATAPTNGHNHQEAPLLPIIVNPLMVGESGDGVPLPEEALELPETANGFSLVNQVIEAPERRSERSSGGAPRPLMVNATPTLPESLETLVARPTLQPSSLQQDDDEWMRRQLGQQGKHYPGREETKKERDAEPNTVIRPSVQLPEQTTNPSQRAQAQIGVSPSASVEETWAAVPAQPDPAADSDEQISLIIEEVERPISTGNPQASPRWECTVEQKGLGVPSEALEEICVTPELPQAMAPDRAEPGAAACEEDIERQQLTSTELPSPPKEISVLPWPAEPTIHSPQREQQQMRAKSPPAAVASRPAQVVVSTLSSNRRAFANDTSPQNLPQRLATYWSNRSRLSSWRISWTVTFL